MKIENYQYPHSSFLSMEKDYGIITNWILKNDRLKKLLYYSTPDCLSKPSLTEEQALSLFGKTIKIVPKLKIDGDERCYLFITFDSFTPNGTNPQFRDNLIFFDIICHMDAWQLQDFELRPYRIAAEIDTMFNGKHLSGIGELEFSGCQQVILSDEFAGLVLAYRAVHGGDDKKFAPNPKTDQQLVSNFNSLFND